MSQFYHFLLFFEFIPLGLFAACIFIDYDKAWNFYARIFIAVSMIILNIIQFIIEVMLEYNYSYWSSVMMVFLWGTNLLFYCLRLKKRNFKQKEFSTNLQKREETQLLQLVSSFVVCVYLENYFEPFFFGSVSLKG